MIVVETRLKEIFDTLPEINGSKPVFGFGTDIKLTEFLAAKLMEKVYPLIWLVHENTVLGDKNNVHCPSMLFILATLGQPGILNDHRVATTIDDVLSPLYDNVTSSFYNTVTSVNPIKENRPFGQDIVFDYTNENEKNKSKTIFRWDAIKLNCSLDFNNCKLQQINY